jgi:hypothetical protein
MPFVRHAEVKSWDPSHGPKRNLERASGNTLQTFIEKSEQVREGLTLWTSLKQRICGPNAFWQACRGQIMGSQPWTYTEFGKGLWEYIPNLRWKIWASPWSFDPLNIPETQNLWPQCLLSGRSDHGNRAMDLNKIWTGPLGIYSKPSLENLSKSVKVWPSEHPWYAEYVAQMPFVRHAEVKSWDPSHGPKRNLERASGNTLQTFIEKSEQVREGLTLWTSLKQRICGPNAFCQACRGQIMGSQPWT